MGDRLGFRPPRPPQINVQTPCKFNSACCAHQLRTKSPCPLSSNHTATLLSSVGITDSLFYLATLKKEFGLSTAMGSQWQHSSWKANAHVYLAILKHLPLLIAFIWNSDRSSPYPRGPPYIQFSLCKDLNLQHAWCQFVSYKIVSTIYKEDTMLDGWLLEKGYIVFSIGHKAGTQIVNHCPTGAISKIHNWANTTLQNIFM